MKLTLFMLVGSLVSLQAFAQLPSVQVDESKLGKGPLADELKKHWSSPMIFLAEAGVRSVLAKEYSRQPPLEAAKSLGFYCFPPPSKSCLYTGFVTGEYQGFEPKNPLLRGPFAVIVQVKLLDYEDPSKIRIKIASSNEEVK